MPHPAFHNSAGVLHMNEKKIYEICHYKYGGGVKWHEKPTLRHINTAPPAGGIKWDTRRRKRPKT